MVNLFTQPDRPGAISSPGGPLVHLRRISNDAYVTAERLHLASCFYPAHEQPAELDYTHANRALALSRPPKAIPSQRCLHVLAH